MAESDLVQSVTEQTADWSDARKGQRLIDALAAAESGGQGAEDELRAAWLEATDPKIPHEK